MKNTATILKAHSIETRTEGDRLLALDVVAGPNHEDCSAWVDCTEWTTRQIREWLGY